MCSVDSPDLEQEEYRPEDHELYLNDDEDVENAFNKRYGTQSLQIPLDSQTSATSGLLL